MMSRRCRATLSGLAAFGTLAAIFLIGGARAGDDFDSFAREQDAKFKAFADSVDSGFLAFVAEENRKFNDFVAEVDRLWDETVYSTRKDYVEYSDSFQSRVHVDFENGQVESSILVTNLDQPDAMGNAAVRLAEQLKDVIVNPGRLEQYASDAPDVKTGEPPLLSGQLVDRNGLAVDAQNADKFVREAVASGQIAVDTIQSRDGRRRIKLTVVQPLVPDHLRKRAQQFLPQAVKFSEQLDLDLRLVMAIIHTESYFNPRATSQIPAYGLMQLVPGTGGRDAFRHLYGKDQMPSPDYLYDPTKNIELGCAYLNLLRTKYLAGIRGNQEAYPCMIASYNGGIGTVCEALTGSKNLDALSRKLKDMNGSEITARLEKSLPYKETRDYLKNVLERMALYDEWAE